ncbi:MAG: hypothetical protein U5K74_05770 [Gemmatimonadaceae bacterium]|nr:hypothetical protein [Gemmatimonadaceae bacterium]
MPALRQVTTFFVQAQRTALTKQYNVIVSIDVPSNRLAIRRGSQQFEHLRHRRSHVLDGAGAGHEVRAHARDHRWHGWYGDLRAAED